MICEKCKGSMIHICENTVQGWSCPFCGWEILTSYFEEICLDNTEYSVYVKKVAYANRNQIKRLSKIASVNYVTAKKILENEYTCILKAGAIAIREAIRQLEGSDIPFEVIPKFDK